jgi:DeoR/GlpR family transcriptional regulator of sugar metabolism
MGSARPSEAAVEQRRQEILRYVVDRRETRIDALADRFEVSLMTMHRDLDDLASRKLLRKHRGRVEAFPSMTMETATRFRERLNESGKELLAAASVDQVQAGSTIIMDDSTTLFPLARRLVGIEQLTVFTNSVRVAQILSQSANAEVMLVGGRYQQEYDSSTGPEVLRSLSRLRADVSFSSTPAITGGRLFHPIRDYAEIKEAMWASAGRNVLLADHSKFGRTATFAYGDARSYDLVVTDDGVPSDELDAVRDLEVEVRVVAGSAESPSRPQRT